MPFSSWDTCLGKPALEPPPPPPPLSVEASRIDAASDALAALNGGGGEATPAARKSRGRRSSVGSVEGESNTPTRRSARIASRQQAKVA